MSFFEESYISAKSLFDTAVKKAGDTIEVQKIKIEIARLNSGISNDFATLGELYYNELNGAEKDQIKTDSIITGINSKKQKIIEQNKKLDEARHNITCQKCGRVNSNDSAFCSGCGEKL